MTDNNLSPELRQNLDRRLQRLEGQVRGIREMLEKDRECQDILTQLSAVRGAAYKISLLLVQNYAQHCLNDPEAHSSQDEALARMVKVLGKLA